MCQHSEEPKARQLIGLTLMQDGYYSLSIASWNLTSDKIDRWDTFNGLTLGEAEDAIDGVASAYFVDPF